MNLKFTFEYPCHDWAILHVFKLLFSSFKNEYPNIDIIFENASEFDDRDPSGPYSAHVMTIKNLQNDKYLLVSYWDRPEELTCDYHGWDSDNCVDIITSAGHKPKYTFTPFSYLPYSTEFDFLSKKSKKMCKKWKNELSFRGYLYGQRFDLAQVGKIKITDERICPYSAYFEDLTNTKICLSLNGAGEICNRDIEILSARSVLLRQKLYTKFHNDLIPDYHYVAFDYDENPKIQSEIILDKFEEIKNNEDFLSFVSENGYKWFKKNGTVESNASILRKLIDINKLL
jgi:hypothetical protein